MMAMDAASADEDHPMANQQQALEQQDLLAEERRLRSEADRIALERSHAQEEGDALREHQLATEMAITVQVGDATERKQLLEQSLTAVDTEIADLERRLALKQDERKGLAADLTVAEESIAEVRRTFQRQLQHIEDRQAQVRLIQEACDADDRALEDKWATLKAGADALEAAQRSRALRRRLLTAGADAIAAVLSALSSGDVAEGGGANGEGGEDCATAASLGEVAALLLAAVARHRDTAALAAKLAVDLAAAQEAAAALERDKKTHAAAKRFREAAAAVKDEKACLERKEVLEAAMARAAHDAAAFAREADDLAQKHSDVKQQLEATQRRADARRLAAIAARKQEMVKAKQRLDNDLATATTSITTTNSGGIGESVASLHNVLSAALDAEIDVLNVFCGAFGVGGADASVEASAEAGVTAMLSAQQRFENLLARQVAAVAAEDFDTAASLEDEIEEARQELLHAKS